MSEPGLELKPTTIPRLAVLGVVVLAYFSLLLAAASGAPVAFTLLLSAAIILDVHVEREQPWLRGLLKTSQLSVSVRGVLATLGLALLMTRSFPRWSDRHLIVVVAIATSLPLARSVYLGVLNLYRARADRPLATRNVEIGDLADPPPVSRWLTTRMEKGLVLLGGVPLLLGAIGVITGREWPFLSLAVAYDAVVLALTGYLARHVWTLLRRPKHEAWEDRVLARIRALDAQVVLYFSGSADSAYQVDMWLETLEAMPYRTVVLVRERSVFERIAPTTLPVVCMPKGVSVMQAGLSGTRVALYAANTSKNLHMLREPAVQHVFIGHGDSDKVSSINPFVRVYDQVWVAGPAARDRWARADVGVRDEAVVEVGRPQLDSVAVATGPREPLTVLYAPTWEGWNDDTFFSSITRMGPVLVERLLALDPPVRVLYKPHPFTGSRDPRARRASEAIESLLAAANERRPGQAAATTAPAPPLRRPGEAVPDFRARLAAWARDWWASVPPEQHVVVPTPGPALYDCFDLSDLLVADVSSVVSDYIASGKPYVCANPQGLPHDRFRAENPSADAAYLLDPDCAGVAELVAVARGDDPRAADRARLREYLLGPAHPPSLQKWAAALGALVESPTADARRGVAAPAIGDESVLEELDPAASAQPDG